MKIRNNDIFSRPMLKEIQTDFKKKFTANFEISTQKEELILLYKIELESEAFQEYCKNNNTTIYLHLYSQNIMYREVHEIPLDKLEGQVRLDRNKVFSKIEISPILVAQKEFLVNANGELEDEEDNFYQVKKGMILGYAETIELEIDFSKTKLDDLVTIKPTENEQQSNVIEIHDDCIIYNLSNEEFNSYKELYESDNEYTKRLIKIVHNAIYTCLLYHVIENREKEDFLNTQIYEYIEQVFSIEFPDEQLTEISSDQVNYYAMRLSNISFVNITTEGESDD